MLQDHGVHGTWCQKSLVGGHGRFSTSRGEPVSQCVVRMVDMNACCFHSKTRPVLSLSLLPHFRGIWASKWQNSIKSNVSLPKLMPKIKSGYKLSERATFQQKNPFWIILLTRKGSDEDEFIMRCSWPAALTEFLRKVVQKSVCSALPPSRNVCDIWHGLWSVCR